MKFNSCSFLLNWIDEDGKSEFSCTACSGTITQPEKSDFPQNYPNPFNPSTTIKYAIPLLGGASGGLVTLKVYDILGNEVATLVDEYKPVGSHEIEFDFLSGIGNLVSVVFLYRLQSGNFVETRKMLLLR